MALSRNVEESFKNFLYPDPEADDFQNLISYSVSTDTSVVKFHEDSLSSFYVKLLTDRRTDKQTPGQQHKLSRTRVGHFDTSATVVYEQGKTRY